MERLALAVLLGTVAGLWLRPPFPIPLLFIAAVPAIILLAWRGWPVWGWLLAAYCWATFNAASYQAALPIVAQYPSDRIVSGCIVDFPRINERSSAFLFKVLSPQEAAGLMYLRSFNSSWEPVTAQCYDLSVRLKPPFGLSNRGQFDRQRWFMAGRVTATGYVRHADRIIQRDDLQPIDPMLRIRSYVRKQIRASVTSEIAASLLEGLTVGVRAGLTQEHWAIFRATGTVHLMSISGLHVGLVAGSLWWMMLAMCSRLTSPGRYRWPAFLAAAAGAIFYALMAGWSVPTSRAALMFMLLTAATVRHRSAPLSAILAAALIATLFSDPFAVLSAGFWMSYLAVWLLVTMPIKYVAVPEAGRSLAYKTVTAGLALMRAQWRLTLGLTLPNVVLFDAWAPLSPLVNLFAIPVFSLLLLPMALFSTLLVCLSPFAGGIFMQWTASLLEGAMAGLTYLAHSPWGQSDLLAGNPAVDALLIVLSLTLLLPGPLRCWPAYTGLPAVAATLVLVVPRPPLQVDVLDVGQGTAILVRTERHTLLIDTGPGWPGGDAGQTTVLPFLRHAGVRQLDAIIVSHGDSDHSGGLRSIVDAIDVDIVLTPAPIADSGHLRCARGMSWQWDDVAFRVLHPAKLSGWSENEASCVLQIIFRGVRVLLPGDIEAAAEAVLTAKQPDLRSALVVAPHHGSGTSSALDFVAAVQPSFVVYTTAFLNRWGFPKPVVMRRWQSAGACGLNTAITGALSFVWEQDGQLVLQSMHKHHWTRPWAIRPVSDDYCLEV